VTGSNGLIQYAPHNLIAFSEQFDNAAWTKTRATITANTEAAPDGATTADKIISTAVNDSHFIKRDVLSAVMTLSVYAKQGEYTHLKLATNAHGFEASYFNLSNGTVAQQGANHVAIISSVGNDWYRCSITPTDAFASAFIENSGNTASPTHLGDGTSGIFIWGAQLELGSTATTYNPTTVKNLLGFTEHFDNAAWTKSNSFVQTNLLTNSEAFDAAAWTKLGATVSANTTTAPNATTTADKLVEDTSTGVHRAQQAPTTAAGTYTFSVYAKAAGRNFMQIRDGLSGVGVWFNLATGAVATQNAGITGFVVSVGDDWYRCVAVRTTTGANALFSVSTADADGTNGHTGDGTSGLFLWGAQLVQGTSAGDYKATYAAAAAVGYTDIYGQPFAQKLVENTASAVHVCTQTYSPTAVATYCFSAYAKSAGGARLLELHAGNGISGAVYAFFDIDTGVLKTNAVSVGTGFDAISAEIAPVGESWYRCSITLTKTNATGSVNCAFRLSNGAFNQESIVYTGDGTSGIYIFGAQLSDSASVDPYVYQPVAAPASTAYYGPRFDYDPVTLAPKGLLIEESRTNLALYSQNLGNAAWTKSAASVTSNAGTAPDGTATVEKLVENLALGFHQVLQNTASVGNSVIATNTIYAKPDGRGWIRLMYDDGVNNKGCYFDITTGAVGTAEAGVTGSIVLGPLGFYRCAITYTQAAASTRSRIQVMLATDNGAAGYTGDGTSGVFLWGAQVELGAFQTSYVPSVASQVTRAADNASMIGNNFARWYNVNEGGVFADSTRFDTGVAAVYQIDDTSANNRIVLGHNVSGVPNLTVVTGGAVQAALVFGAVSANANKIAAAYKADDFAGSRDGGAVLTDTSGSVPIVSRLVIGADNTTTAYLNGNIKRIAYFNRRLADSELIGITS
jgi:hypothetical protein